MTSAVSSTELQAIIRYMHDADSLKAETLVPTTLGKVLRYAAAVVAWPCSPTLKVGDRGDSTVTK